MTMHSLEGIMVVVIIFILGALLSTFYILWRYAEAKLKKYQSLEDLEDCQKATKSKLIAPKIPIIYGHIESSSKPAEARKPINTPPSSAKTILMKAFSISSITRNISKVKSNVNHNREEPRRISTIISMWKAETSLDFVFTKLE